MSIAQIQNEIITEISEMKGDVEMILLYIVNAGKILPLMPQEFKTEANIVKGCHSKIWLAALNRQEVMHFYADSDTIISKGLAGLLIRILNGQPREEILNADLYFVRQKYLQRFIGDKRSSGFAAMIYQMKNCSSTI